MAFLECDVHVDGVFAHCGHEAQHSVVVIAASAQAPVAARDEVDPEYRCGFAHDGSGSAEDGEGGLERFDAVDRWVAVETLRLEGAFEVEVVDIIA